MRAIMGWGLSSGVRLRTLKSGLPAALALVCLGVAYALLGELDHFIPVRTWFVWKVASLWFWELIFVSGCLALGVLICERALKDSPELGEGDRLLFALAGGAVAFAMLVYLAGALHLLSAAFAVGMPATAIAAALVWVRPQMVSAVREMGNVRIGMTPLRLGAIVFGAIALALVYLHVLNPDALNHDAHWTHVVIAQDYAREGRIVPIYGSWARNFPHLASIFYTWCYLVPGLTEQEKLLLVMHTEFVFFLGTLLSIGVAVRWLTYDRETTCSASWAAYFLFPSIFVYDSNLGGSADHVAAFFMVPLFLAFLRGTERFSLGLCALAGAMAGAALITKYQSVYATAALALVVSVRLGARVIRHVRGAPGAGPKVRSALIGTGVLIGAAMLSASPYFVENAIFYRNPFFPFMQDTFTGSTPTLPDSAWLVSNVATASHARAVAAWGPRLLNGLASVFTFVFRPHYAFTNGVPYFGFLFTLLAPLSLFIPRGHRLRLGALVGGFSVLAWGMTYLVDRNLQIALPILVAVTAGVMTTIWRLGWVARVGLVPVIAIQVVWGADFMFEGPMQASIAHIRDGAAGRVNVRETIHRRAMTQALPPDAVVLLHSEHVSLGLDRTVLADLSESQGLIDYHRFRTPREAYDRFHALGVTHLTWIESAPMITPVKQADIIFLALVKGLPASMFGPYKLVQMPSVPPPAVPPYRVMVLGVSGYPDGVYPIQELSKCEMRPPSVCTPPRAELQFGTTVPATIVDSVDAVLTAPGRGPDPSIEAALRRRIQLAKSTTQYDLYLAR